MLEPAELQVPYELIVCDTGISIDHAGFAVEVDSSARRRRVNAFFRDDVSIDGETSDDETN